MMLLSECVECFATVSTEDAIATQEPKQAVLSIARPVERAMNIELTPEQRALVQKAIESGRFTREEDAVQEALALWEERERRRVAILAMLDEADAELARGGGIEITTESMKALAEEAKQRLRRRIESEIESVTRREATW
jgi:Arc/MetJ-type ribon-helix-helix transcriptional regulator